MRAASDEVALEKDLPFAAFAPTPQARLRGRVLMVCYHFPPANNGGVERSAKFARDVSGYGWLPLVVTRATDAAARRPPDDVCRVRAFGETLLERVLGRGESAVRWALAALGPAMRRLARHDADLIYSTSPPESAHLAALALKLATRRPWVMDLRDAWTIDAIRPSLRVSGARQRLEGALEALCFAAADRVILNTPEAAARYRERFPGLAGRLVVITNGFDRDEVEAARDDTTPLDCLDGDGDRFVISHVGSFARDASRGGPRSFLAALRSLLEDGIVSRNVVRVVFAGPRSERVEAEVRDAGLEDVVRLPGVLPHEDALRLMTRSDLLLLHDPPDDGTTYVRGKTYEYLASGTPVLAMVPPGATRALLASEGGASIVPPDDAQAARDVLRVLLARDRATARSERSGDRAPGAGLERFERRELSRRLVRIFEEVTA